jgi:L-ascorbate metabolism protein UlaG (beta-lactamase superfamily)
VLACEVFEPCAIGVVHMRVTLDWLGVSTFRLTVGNLVLFLDAYLDRVPAAPPVGLTTADVTRADFVLVGHSHFDHLWGAERIAARTGATVIGSHETVRLLRDVDGVPERQLVAVAGGEPIELPGGIRVRVYPALHSCIWATMGAQPDEACLGDLGVAQHERAARVARGMEMLHGGALGDDVARHMAASDRHPRGEGGSFAYLIETPAGSIFWKDTSGHWSGILRDLRPDVALLAAVGRGNVDGEPVQGTLAEFVAAEVGLLRPREVILCHHDDWMPPLTRPTDVGPIRHELARRTPGAKLVEMGYLEGRPILG